MFPVNRILQHFPSQKFVVTASTSSLFFMADTRAITISSSHTTAPIVWPTSRKMQMPEIVSLYQTFVVITDSSSFKNILSRTYCITKTTAFLIQKSRFQLSPKPTKATIVLCCSNFTELQIKKISNQPHVPVWLNTYHCCHCLLYSRLHTVGFRANSGTWYIWLIKLELYERIQRELKNPPPGITPVAHAD